MSILKLILIIFIFFARTTQSASIRTEVNAESSTGDNFVSSGGKIINGDSKSSIEVKNLVGENKDEIILEIESTSSSSSKSNINIKDNNPDNSEDTVEIKIDGKDNILIKINGQEINLPENSDKLKLKIQNININDAEIKTKDDLEKFVEITSLSNKNIVETSVATNTIKVIYEHKAKFLGLIPTTLKETITLNNEKSSPEVIFKKPWHRFFFKEEFDLAIVERDFNQTSAKQTNVYGSPAKTAKSFIDLLKILNSGEES